MGADAGSAFSISNVAFSNHLGRLMLGCHNDQILSEKLNISNSFLRTVETVVVSRLLGILISPLWACCILNRQ